MNNKGFAITGIIYTTFMLFLLILVSIMANLRFKNNVLKKSIESFDDTYRFNSSLVLSDDIEKAPYTGLYEYSVSITNSEESVNIGNITCLTYLKKDFLLAYSANMVFTTKTCNDLKKGIYELKTYPVDKVVFSLSKVYY